VDLKLRRSVAQSRSVELVDGENTDATLRATLAADEPVTASARSVGQGGVHNLN
jgi:hypothetical protein